MTNEEKQQKTDEQERIAKLRKQGPGMPPRLAARMSDIVDFGELQLARQKREKMERQKDRDKRRRDELLAQLAGNYDAQPHGCSPEEA